MTAFEIVADTFIDECQIEIVENPSLPKVVDERNPFHFQVDYRDKIWHCEAHYQCKENPDQYVTIVREYTNETVAAISVFYDGEDESDDE